MRVDRGEGQARGVSRSDLVLAALLFGATVLSVAVQPHNLGPADESVYLYEAKRVLEGAVPYRDLFEITTPGWLYLMAFVFRLGGVDIATARLAMAVMHGITAVLIYATCRRLDIRRNLAWPAGLAYLVVCQPAWPIASQHWLGTLLTVLLLLACTDLADAAPRRGVIAGVVVGLLIGVHQQRGVAVGIGIAVWLIADHLLQSRDATAPRPAALLARLAWVAAGTALVVLPLAIVMIASAGFAPVWQALVIHPLVNYRGAMHATWGEIATLTAPQGTYTFPRLLAYLPAIVAIDLLRLAMLAARRRGGEQARRLLLLIVFCLGSMLSIAYYPDFIHIAFIAPVFFIAIAEAAERAARAVLQRSSALRLAGYLAGAALVLACGLRLRHNLARMRAAYPISRDTAFGRVDFAQPVEAQLYDTVRELIDRAPSRALFCYPIISYLYLMADADNPTRYQFLLSGYTSAAQMQEVVDDLQRRQLPYIVAFTVALRPDDPVWAYLRRDYEPLAEAGEVGKVIFRRKSAAPPS